MRKFLVIVLTTLLSVTAVLTACAAPATTPVTTPVTTQTPTPSQQIVWQIGTGIPTKTGAGPVAGLAMIDAVEKRTNGRLKMVWHISGELPYAAPDLIRVVGQGQIQMALIFGSGYVGDIPALGVYGLAFLFSSLDESLRAIDDPQIVAIRQAAFAKFNVLEAGTQASGPGLIGSTRVPIRTISDFKGLRIRMPGTHQIAALKALGSTAVTLAISEVYTALQTGLLDGMMTGDIVFYTAKYYEVVRYILYEPAWLFDWSGYIVNKDAFNALPADVQKILVEEMANAGKEARLKGTATSAEIMPKLKAVGVEFTKLSSGDQETAKKLIEPTWSAWIDSTGNADAKKTYQRILDIMR